MYFGDADGSVQGVADDGKMIALFFFVFFEE